VNQKKLLKYAIDYLSKYDSSKKNLIEVIKRKIFRLNISGIEKSKLINEIENIILKLEKNDLINDKRYIFSKISSLSRLGKSKIFIFNYLIKKGIKNTEIEESLEVFLENNDNWELNSAKLYAKKKRLLQSDEAYEKKLAKMARAGFSYDICKKILN
tara:strand:+ start:1366 stop:1836 length:471 start_codon:yes stop_codon:yes gene_type:complete